MYVCFMYALIQFNLRSSQKQVPSAVRSLEMCNLTEVEQHFVASFRSAVLMMKSGCLEMCLSRQHFVVSLKVLLMVRLGV